MRQQRAALSLLIGAFVMAVALTTFLGAGLSANAEEIPAVTSDMVVEWLKFRVEPAQRERYLATDEKIWTSALARYPGFVDKTTWLSPDCEDEVIYVIRWQSRDQWKDIPEADLAAIGQRFDEALGFPYELLEEKEFYIP